MLEGTYTETIDSNIVAVYNKIANLEDTSWREDLAGVKKEEEDKYLEAVIDGSVNELTIIKRQPPEYFEYISENKNFRSHWAAKLVKIDENNTEVQIAERLEFKKGITGFISQRIVKLDKIHRTYIRNLIWALLDVAPHPAEVEAARKQKELDDEAAAQEEKKRLAKEQKLLEKEEKKKKKKGIF